MAPNGPVQDLEKGGIKKNEEEGRKGPGVRLLFCMDCFGEYKSPGKRDLQKKYK